MAEGWAREEVEATVSDYLDMLEAEIRGVLVNKSEHRRALRRVLHSRSDTAVERKHQNISAALVELGLPYIDGYKPLANYQRLLFDVVADRVAGSPRLVEAVAMDVVQPALVPTIDDILAALVDAPSKPTPSAALWPRRIQEAPRTRTGTDYLAIEAHNRSLGGAGEEFVARFEVARLLSAGNEQLASRVERVSQTRGDGAGFDVLSFEASGRERLIEVKTTRYGRDTPFYVSRNELAVSRAQAAAYHIYRVFDFRRQPRFYLKQGQIDNGFLLDPIQYVARIA